MSSASKPLRKWLCIPIILARRLRPLDGKPWIARAECHLGQGPAHCVDPRWPIQGSHALLVLGNAAASAGVVANGRVGDELLFLGGHERRLAVVQIGHKKGMKDSNKSNVKVSSAPMSTGKQTKGIRLIHTSNADFARQMASDGWCPIECSFGSGSVMDALCMDHHGSESHREGVALRAYRDHFAACKERAQFIVTGAADADATFAIAALAGLLPHPSREEEFTDSPPWIKAAMTADLSKLAATVNTVDIDPISNQVIELPHGELVLLWNQLSSGCEDRSAFHAGVDRWRFLTGSRAPKALLDSVKDTEALRVTESRKAELHFKSQFVACVESPVWGFDVWYQEHAPCVLAYVDGSVTIGCRDDEMAEMLFGPGGLKNVFEKLQPEGWGGRETIGGGPRGVTLTVADTIAAARAVVAAIIL